MKLDPQFVRRLETDERLRAVVEAAHEWEVTVVALAVEDEAMAERAERVGFDLGAGVPLRPSRTPGAIDELLAAVVNARRWTRPGRPARVRGG